MKKIFSVIAALALVCFATSALAVDLSNPAAAVGTAVSSEAGKALAGEVVVGTVKKIDTKAKTILVNGQTITVKADDLAELKKGDKVRVSLEPGTMNAKKIVPLGKTAAQKEAKKEAGQAKDKAINTAADKAVEKVSQ